ncbi:MAG: hypothetical protein U0X20_23785 [Caldilineaceae bacterium]
MPKATVAQTAAAAQATTGRAFEIWNGQGKWVGWKLHLNTGGDPNTAKQISAYLKGKYLHKVGRAGGQDGKDLTIYVGGRGAAQQLAEDLNVRFDNVLLDAGADVAVDDRQFAGKVWGRFDTAADTNFSQYGGAGVPYLADDILNARYGGMSKEQVRDNAARWLTNKYGEYFTGTVTPVRAPAEPPPLPKVAAPGVRIGVEGGPTYIDARQQSAWEVGQSYLERMRDIEAAREHYRNMIDRLLRQRAQPNAGLLPARAETLARRDIEQANIAAAEARYRATIGRELAELPDEMAPKGGRIPGADADVPFDMGPKAAAPPPTAPKKGKAAKIAVEIPAAAPEVTTLTTPTTPRLLTGPTAAPAAAPAAAATARRMTIDEVQDEGRRLYNAYLQRLGELEEEYQRLEEAYAYSHGLRPGGRAWDPATPGPDDVPPTAPPDVPPSGPPAPPVTPATPPIEAAPAEIEPSQQLFRADDLILDKVNDKLYIVDSKTMDYRIVVGQAEDGRWVAREATGSASSAYMPRNDALEWARTRMAAVKAARAEQPAGPAVKVHFNADKQGIELVFPGGKPPEDTIAALKSNGFQWSSKQKLWYAKDTPGRRTFVEGLRQAAPSPAAAAPPPAAVPEPTPAALPRVAPTANDPDALAIRKQMMAEFEARPGFKAAGEYKPGERVTWWGDDRIYTVHSTQADRNTVQLIPPGETEPMIATGAERVRPVVDDVVDPNANLVKPANWQSTQTRPIQVGDLVRRTSDSGLGKPGQVMDIVASGRRDGDMIVKVQHPGQQQPTNYRLSQLERIEPPAPTATTVEEGMRQAAGMERKVTYPKVQDLPWWRQNKPTADRVSKAMEYARNLAPEPEATHRMTVTYQGRTLTYQVRVLDETPDWAVVQYMDDGPDFNGVAGDPAWQAGTVDTWIKRSAAAPPENLTVERGVIENLAPIEEAERLQAAGEPGLFDQAPETAQIAQIDQVQPAPVSDIMEVGSRTGELQGAPYEPVTDAGRISRDDTGALAGAPADNVPGATAERPVAAASRERGSPDLGSGTGDGRPRPEPGGGMGRDAAPVVSDTERGRAGEPGGTGDDLPGRRDTGLGTDDERLATTATHTAAKSGNDLIIDDDLAERISRPGGPVERWNNNVEAIRVLKKIEAEGRQATPAEQRIMARFAGWGDSTLSNTGLNEYKYGKEPAWVRRTDELRGLMTEEEWAAAKASSKNAHYTSPLVVQKMYEGLDRLGVGKLARLRMLEPAVGIGNFFGLMPTEWAARAQRTGVELDNLSARLSQQLYQNAQIINDGFERASIPNDFYDFVLTNVPFEEKYNAVDPFFKPAERFLKRSLHNYYIAKAYTKARPGGVVAVITSRYTMDSIAGLNVRRWIGDRMDLLGAIRLPRTAFEENAGTEVVTDILFFRKRIPGEAPAHVAEWLETPTQKMAINSWSVREVPVNEYFVNHPEQVLGTPSLKGTMYNPNEYTVDADPNRPLAQALDEAIARLPADIITEDRRSAEDIGLGIFAKSGQGVKRNGLTVQDGKVLRNVNGTLREVATEAEHARRIADMLAIRDAANEVVQVQLRDGTDEELDAARLKLNQLYDRYTKAHGALNKADNRALLEGDPDSYFVQALENADGKTWRKADLFTKRVMRGYKEATSAENPRDALLISLRERGRVDMDHIARLLATDEDNAGEMLGDLVYKDPYGDWEIADRYLSGNVRQKLEQARAAAETDPKFQRNVTALEAVQPKDLLPSQIGVRLGSPWIPPDTIGQFVTELLTGSTNYRRDAVTVRFIETNAEWSLSVPDWLTSTAGNTTTWGTNRRNAVELLEDALNSKTPTVYDYVWDGERNVPHVNQDESLAARAKLQEIKDKFNRWVWEDGDRAERLARIYNDKYNVWKPWQPDGSHLTFPGMNPAIRMRPTQRDAVWRTLQGGNVLLAHDVGSGKTFTMIASAMEARRLGIAKKPVIAVKKSTYKSIAQDVQALYPAARILAPSADDFNAANRARTLARIATGDWDVVVVTHEWLEKLPVKAETFNSFIREQTDQIDEVMAELQAAVGYGRQSDDLKRSVKQLEKQKRRLEAKLRKPVEEGAKDSTIYFEDLGIDQLAIDEAHAFKNLFFPTKRPRMPGLSSANADRSVDMFLKVRYITQLNNGRGVTFATGTPILNTIGELYTMQRYLQYDLMKNMGLLHFDNWANNYADAVTVFEMSMTGASIKQRTKFIKFENIPELYQMSSEVFDWVSIDDVIAEAAREGIEIKVPKVKHVPVVSPSDDDWMEFIRNQENRLANLPKSHEYRPGMDHYFKVHNDGKMAAVDLRLAWSAPDKPESKINNLVRNVLDVYKETQAQKGTQVIFSDIGVPSDLARTKEQQGQFANVYREVKEKLVAAGIPEKEIAFIHNAKNDVAVAELFDKVNKGEIRVIMGSTEKLGVGVNIQRRLKAAHQLDVLGRPGDIQQRMGRIVRQGNIFDEVYAFQYLQEPLDSYNLSRVADKARAFDSFKKGDSAVREIEDVDESVMTLSEWQALASGNPLVTEKVKLETQLGDLSRVRRAWMDQRMSVDREIRQLDQQRKAYEIAIERYRQLDEYAKQQPKAARMVLNGTTYEKRGELFAEVQAALNSLNQQHNTARIGSYRGFELTATLKSEVYLGRKTWVTDIEVAYPALGYAADVEASGAEGGMRAVDNLIDGFAGQQHRADEALQAAIARNEGLQATRGADFPQQAKVDELEARLKEINDTLGANKVDEAATIGGEGAAEEGAGDAAEAAAKEYEFSVPNPLSYGGVQDYDELARRVQDSYQNIRKYWRKPKQPEVGDVALHQVKTLNEAEDRLIASLPRLAQQRPNQLDERAKRALINRIDQQLLPKFDDATMGAAHMAESAANGAMLNYKDRRGFDNLLGMIFPYHYYWTRGGATWAKRMVRKPSLMNMAYEAQRAIDNENRQRDVVDRLKGTVLVYRDKNGEYRIANPLQYMFAFYNFSPNRWVDPDEATTAAERWWLRAQAMTPGVYPLIDLAAAALMDAYSPLPDGEKRLGDFFTRKFLPLAGIASDTRLATTGEMTPPWAGGEPYDGDRVRRTLAIMLQEGYFGKDERALYSAQYAQQIALNLEQGKERYDQIPAEYQKTAEAAYKAAAQRAGGERLLSSAGGWATGVPGYYYPQGEADLRAASAQYGAAGYDPTQSPYGSAAGRKEVLGDNPALPAWWSRSTTPEGKSPAQSAQTSEMYNRLDREVYGPMAKEIAAAILANPEVAAADIAGIREKYYDKSDKIKAQYTTGPASGKEFPSGSNPQEQALVMLENLLRVEGAPTWPGDNATDEQKQEYYDNRRKWEAERNKTIHTRFMDVLKTQGQGAPDPAWAELAHLVTMANVPDMIQEFQTLKYASPTERDWQRQHAMDKEMDSRLWESKKIHVANALGEDVAKLYTEYLGLADDKREAFWTAHPELRAANLFANHLLQANQLQGLFGTEAILDWAKRPAYVDTDEGAAARAKYWAEHPTAKIVQAWVYGRPTPFSEGDENKDSRDQVYDWGKDYRTAIEKFGADIWDVYAGYNSAWSKSEKSAYFKAHPNLDGFFDWWYELLPDDGKSGSARRGGYRRYYRKYYRKYYKRRYYSRRGRSYYSRGGGYYSRGGGYSRSRYYGGGGYDSSRYDRPPFVEPREMDKGLTVYPKDRYYPWEARRNTAQDWLRAGENLKPKPLAPWRPLRGK